jgi:hypothetical protein
MHKSRMAGVGVRILTTGGAALLVLAIRDQRWTPCNKKFFELSFCVVAIAFSNGVKQGNGHAWQQHNVDTHFGNWASPLAILLT